MQGGVGMLTNNDQFLKVEFKMHYRIFYAFLTKGLKILEAAQDKG